MPSDYQIYQDEMIRLGHGFPVWYGDPYGGEEIGIGDLGYMDEGVFRCIKHRCGLYDASKIVRRLLDFRTTLYSSNVQEHGFTASVGVEAPVLSDGAQAEIELSTSRSALAILDVETRNGDFISCQEGDKEKIGKTFFQNFPLWLEEAVRDGKVGETFPADRLMIVTGFCKTWNWVAMAMSSGTSKGSLRFSVKATTLADGSLSYNWNTVRKVSPFHSSGHNHPPGSVSPESVASTSQATTELPSTTQELFRSCCREHKDLRNQCIFLRGFRIRIGLLRKHLFELGVQEGRKFVDFLKKSSLGATANPTGVAAAASGTPAVLPNAPNKSAQQQQELNALEPIDGLPDPDAGDCDALYDIVALVKSKENQDSVLVHDEEVITLLETYQSWEELQDPKTLTPGSTALLGYSDEGSASLGSLTSRLVIVCSYAELFYHLLVNCPNPSGPIVETSKPPPTITVPDKTMNPLFALIIGIDAYGQHVGPLRGCVKDATDMRNYLLTDLKVPESQIRFLTDEKAKRVDILAAFQEIKTDSRIKKGDPILIFFAGRGYEIGSSWGIGNKIELLVPQDYSQNPATQVHGLPDSTLGQLVYEIAQQHGNNITVIFDSCHSGSGMHGSRGLARDQRQWVHSDRWRSIPEQDSLPTFFTKGSSHHVVLSACTQKEEAADGSAGGRFTQALLLVLKSTGADKLTYKSLLERMDKLPSQNPQCRGLNRDSEIFDAKVSSTGRVCFPVKMKGMAYEIQAGSFHGITQGAKFGVYGDILTINESNPLTVLVVAFATDIGLFTPTAQIATWSNADITTLPKTACGLQINAGEAEYLLFYSPLDDKLTTLYETLATMMKESYPAEGQIRPVLERVKARLGLSIVDDRIAFDIVDPFLAEYGLTHIPHTVKNDPDEIIPVIYGAAHYYWHLNQEAKNPLSDDWDLLHMSEDVQSVHDFFDIECNTLLPNKLYDFSTRTPWKPIGWKLFHLGVIDVVASDEVGYGFKITNRSAFQFYVNVFYFNNTDFSIESYYQSPKSGHIDRYAPVPPYGGCLTIGYGARGDTPKTYQLEDGVDIDVGYLLFCIDRKNNDLSSIPQQTPFESPGRKSVSKKVPPKPTYITILVPIIKRRTAFI